jgi:hypothetical protein
MGIDTLVHDLLPLSAQAEAAASLPTVIFSLSTCLFFWIDNIGFAISKMCK